MQRCYGPDFFAEVMQLTREYPIKHFLCGGAEGVAARLKENCATRFSNQNIVGTYCPPFRDMDQGELQALAQQINDLEADVIWLGLSTPRQEQTALRLSVQVNARFLVTVGAAFDFHTDRIRQAPAFVQKIGMEWLFRLCMEPGRLWRRYFEIVPKFIYFNFLELITERQHRI